MFTLASLISCILSVLMMILTFVFGNQLASLLGANGNLGYLQSFVRNYLYGFVIGLPAMNMCKLLSTFMQVDGNGKMAIISVIVMTIVDIIGDLLAVFVFNGEMFTVALCTSVGNIICMGTLWLHFLRKDRLLRWVMPKISSIKSFTWDIFKNGIPTGLTRLAATAGSMIVNYIITINVGAVAFAAYGVHMSMKTLVGAVYLGAADTVWSLSGLYYGQEDANSLKQLQRATLRFGLLIAVVSGVLIWVFAPFLANIFMDSAMGRGFEMAIEAVHFFALSMPLFMLVYSFEDYLMGVKRLKFANIYTILLECVVVVASVYLMVVIFNKLGGGWFATPANLGAMAVIAFIYVLFQKGSGNLAQKSLLLSNDSGSATPTCSAEIFSVEDVMETSERVSKFCAENGVESNKALYTGLFVEELGINTIKYGNKKPMIQVRIMIDGEEIVIRISDNCKAFNPKEYYEMLNQEGEDATKNIGIRMVSKLSKELCYMNTFKTNNLMIKI